MTTGDAMFLRVRNAYRPEYEVERELGVGGMGAVYQAEDTALRRKIALKVLHPALATARAEQEFYREAQRLARLKSRQVVPVYHVIQPPRDGLCGFVMELVESGTLAQRLSQTGPLTPGETRSLGLDLLAGLEDIHRAGLVHRDLKPSNVFLTPGRGVIGDLGIGWDSESTRDGHTTTELGRGTRIYLAPEQLVSPSPLSDIYQMGMVLYEACTGKLWPKLPPRDRRLWQGVPRWLRLPLQRALEPDASDRWPDATAFRQALAARIRAPTSLQVLGIALPAVLALWAGYEGVIWLWHRIFPPEPPMAELTILPLSGRDSILARNLTSYIREPFARFSRIAVRSGAETPVLPAEPSAGDLRRLRTRYYVDGEVLGDSVISLRVRDSTSEVLRRIAVPHDTLELLAWGWAAADSIVRRTFSHSYAEFQTVHGCGGSNDADAIREYLAGEEAFQRDAYSLADHHFSKALEYDGNFVLALWQRALAHRWLRSLSWEELRELHQRSKSCERAWFYRLLEAQLETDLPLRLDRYRQVIRESPRIGVAHLLYADDMFHRGALIGRPIDSAVAAMEAAIQADSTQDQAPALDHVIWGYVKLGKQEAAEKAVEYRERVARLRSTPEYSEGALRTEFLRLAYDVRFRPRIGRFKLWWIARDNDPGILKAFSEYVHLASAFDIPGAQGQMGRKLARDGATPGIRAEGFEAQGLALIALGRPEAAVASFDSGAALHGTPAARLETGEWRILAPALGLPAFSPEHQALGRERVQQLVSHPEVGDRAAWALAMEAYARGDIAGGRGLANAIRRASNTSTHRLLRLLAAFDTASAGNPTAALALSDSLVRWDPLVRAGDPFARAILYLARGKWQERSGNYPAAERSFLWYENTDLDGWGLGEAQAGQIDVALSGIARISRARVARLQGRTDVACHYLDRVDELWRDAESGFAALRDSVRTGLEQCR